MINTRGITITACIAALTFGLVVSPSPAAPLVTELRPEAVRAFNDYVKRAERLHKRRNAGEKPFLWIDDDHRNRLTARKGEIVTHHNEVDEDIPNGMIHDWIGAMFIPEGTIDDVVATLQDFDRHPDIYPEAVRAKLIARKGDLVQSYLRLVKKKVLTVTLDSEYDAYYERLDGKRMVVRSYSTKIVQVENAGTPKEEILPEGKDSGFLWRLNAYWRMEQQADGVFVELSTISLSRDIPRALGWMIKPFLTSIPRESLIGTLQATRRDVMK